MTSSAKLRVLVAEDSPPARALLVEILRSDPGLEVVGEAVNGIEAVEMTRRMRPDVVTMDIRMPLMDGLQATKAIMAETPTPIIIISASAEQRDVEISMQALRAGALSVLPTPIGPGSPGFPEECRRLTTTVKTMAGVKVVRRWQERPPAGQRPAGWVAKPRVVAVAASTGGPAALQQLLSALPVDFPVPMLVVQHIAPGFVNGLAAWLDAVSPLEVKVAEEGEPLRAHYVYFAPDGRDLGVSDRGTVSLSIPRAGSLHCPSATPLFESVARVYGASALALILTGMGKDGLEGLASIKRARGRVVAQDEETSIVFGMPAAAIDAGLADLVLPLSSIASMLVELTNGPDRRSP
jgi:two-component system chemotaxis response regulator CheB